MPREDTAGERVVDGGMVVACFAAAGALAIPAPIAVGLGAALVLVVFALGSGRVWGERPWVARFVALVAAFGFVLSAARASSRIDAHRAAREAVGPATGLSLRAPAPWPARCALEGVVARSPTWLGGSLHTAVDVRSGACAPEREGRGADPSGLRIALALPAGEDGVASPVRGDVVRVVALVAPTHVLRNPDAAAAATWASASRRGVVLSGGALDTVVVARAPPWRVGAWLDRLRARVRERIRATFPASTEAMARALVLGEDDVAEGDRRAFQASGLSHLLAVSGMHLVIVVASAVSALRAVLVRLPRLASAVPPDRVASAFGIPLAFLYADLAGGSGSALRAAFMTATALAARAIGRRPSPWRSLALSVLAMLVVDPLAPFDLSFALSVAATLGLLVVARPIDRALSTRLPAGLAWSRAPLAATAGASIACAPLLAALAPELPVASVIANVLAVPVGEVVALPLCLVHAALALLAPTGSGELGCALAAGGALDLVRALARVFAAIPHGSVPVPPPTPFESVLLATVLGLAAVRALRLRSAAVLAIGGLVLAEGLARREGAPHGLLRVTFLDVAQGDAALVDLPDGSAMLLDGGGLVGSPLDIGERVVAPVLRARRRTELRALVLSHPHPDHFLGLASGLARVRVASFWDTGQGESEGAEVGPYASLLTRLRGEGAVVERPGTLCGRHLVGGAVVEVLAPCPRHDPERGPNDNSLVVRIRFGARSVLFVGDAEHAEEEDLLGRSLGSLRADVLKVGHHGSRTSTSEPFLAAVMPSVAVVSSGVRNRFGHPHGATLRTLARVGATTFRTDTDGATTVTTDGSELRVETAESAF